MTSSTPSPPSVGKDPEAWLFAAPGGGPLRESNWKRSVGWRSAKVAAGLPDVRVHDLRHTAASLWLAAGPDPKVVQRVLGHATAAMTLALYRHLVDASLWQAAPLIGGATGHLSHRRGAFEQNPSQERIRKIRISWAFVVEPPIGIEPMTYALRETRSLPAHALAAPITRKIARIALTALGLSKDTFHEPFHARGRAPHLPAHHA